jgi:hypothetical protein
VPYKSRVENLKAETRSMHIVSFDAWELRSASSTPGSAGILAGFEAIHGRHTGFENLRAERFD